MWQTWEACNPIRGLFLTDEVGIASMIKTREPAYRIASANAMRYIDP
jgi:hypothetical protein